MDLTPKALVHVRMDCDETLNWLFVAIGILLLENVTVAAANGTVDMYARLGHYTDKILTLTSSHKSNLTKRYEISQLSLSGLRIGKDEESTTFYLCLGSFFNA